MRSDFMYFIFSICIYIWFLQKMCIFILMEMTNEKMLASSSLYWNASRRYDGTRSIYYLRIGFLIICRRFRCRYDKRRNLYYPERSEVKMVTTSQKEKGALSLLNVNVSFSPAPTSTVLGVCPLLFTGTQTMRWRGRGTRGFSFQPPLFVYN